MIAFLALSLSLAVPAHMQAFLLQAQYNALMDFYNAIGCANSPMCPRFAVSEPCPPQPSLRCQSPGVVTHIQIVNASLKGTIPAAALKLLFQLTWLNLNASILLTSTLPTEIGLLTNLQHLEMWPTGLSGSVPTELAKLTNANLINLSESDFTGTIPSELGRLQRLTHLGLDNNALSGTIPVELEQLTSLKEFYFQRNYLSGSVPMLLNNVPGCLLMLNRTSRIETNCFSSCSENCCKNSTRCPDRTTRSGVRSAPSTTTTTMTMTMTTSTTSPTILSSQPIIVGTTAMEPITTTTTVSSSLFDSAAMQTPDSMTDVWIAIGVVGGILVIGVIVGVALFLKRRGPAAASSTAMSSSASHNINSNAYGVLPTMPAPLDSEIYEVGVLEQ